LGGWALAAGPKSLWGRECGHKFSKKRTIQFVKDPERMNEQIEAAKYTGNDGESQIHIISLILSQKSFALSCN
jgi:hypothetical protein